MVERPPADPNVGALEADLGLRGYVRWGSQPCVAGLPIASKAALLVELFSYIRILVDAVAGSVEIAKPGAGGCMACVASFLVCSYCFFCVLWNDISGCVIFPESTATCRIIAVTGLLKQDNPLLRIVGHTFSADIKNAEPP